ncbi:MAG: hypothetical protein HYV68_01360 [Candidatus Taylorbacteria bacterium]|nr:hypothetical protein [Candidatus Taylorbacteria bacterium]
MNLRNGLIIVLLAVLVVFTGVVTGTARAYTSASANQGAAITFYYR